MRTPGRGPAPGLEGVSHFIAAYRFMAINETHDLGTFGDPEGLLIFLKNQLVPIMFDQVVRA